MAIVTEHLVKTGDHQTFYLATGPEAGPPVILCHGWPELSPASGRCHNSGAVSVLHGAGLGR
jgi:pimeloyl-ACP methyl ester carboxylesterase